MSKPIPSIDAVQDILAGENYICGRALATVVFLSVTLGRPIFLEGEAGSVRRRSPRRWRQPSGGG